MKPTLNLPQWGNVNQSSDSESDSKKHVMLQPAAFQLISTAMQWLPVTMMKGGGGEHS